MVCRFDPVADVGLPARKGIFGADSEHSGEAETCRADLLNDPSCPGLPSSLTSLPAHRHSNCRRLSN